jgi:hypothetical protein
MGLYMGLESAMPWWVRLLIIAGLAVAVWITADEVVVDCINNCAAGGGSSGAG